MVIVYLQAFVVDHFDDRSNSFLPKFWCSNSSQRSIAEKECAIVTFCSASSEFLRFVDNRNGHTFVLLLEL